MISVDKNYFPGWVRKAISFTIDDGDLEMDKKFIDITSPYGIKGTFNIPNFHFNELSPEGYRELYRGYEIANHVRLHPYAFSDGIDYRLYDGPRPEVTDDDCACYLTKDPGVYEVRKIKGWRKITDADNYIRLTRECTEEIRRVFGGERRLGFVWPFGMQKNIKVFEALKKEGFYGLRKTGGPSLNPTFSLPKDRNEWSYNANNEQLLEEARKFEEFPDDGELKAFIFGVHAKDFERSENWCDLEVFSKTYGNRPEDYWYATNIDIFEYEDAVNMLKITDEGVENPSDLTLYIKVDGERITLAPHSQFKF